MAGLFATLFTNPIRRLAQNFIEKGVRANMAPSAIADAVRKAGFRLPRMTILNDAYTWQSIIRRGSGMKYLSRDGA